MSSSEVEGSARKGNIHGLVSLAPACNDKTVWDMFLRYCYDESEEDGLFQWSHKICHRSFATA